MKSGQDPNMKSESGPKQTRNLPEPQLTAVLLIFSLVQPGKR